MRKQISFNSANGKIVGLLDLPVLESGEKCPIAIILHGIGDHKATPFMSTVSDSLLNKGIGTLRIDLNGHGESDGNFTDMTISSEAADAIAAVHFAKQLPEAARILLIGHSQGGVASILAAGKIGNEIDNLVLLAPAIVLKDGAKNGNILGGEFDPNHLPETLPIVWGVLGRKYIEDAKQLPIHEEFLKYKGKVTIIHGTADNVVPTLYSEKLKELNKTAELVLLKDFGHSFEPNGSEVGKYIN